LISDIFLGWMVEHGLKYFAASMDAKIHLWAWKWRSW
jgi:hypothetical protein